MINKGPVASRLVAEHVKPEAQLGRRTGDDVKADGEEQVWKDEKA